MAAGSTDENIEFLTVKEFVDLHQGRVKESTVRELVRRDTERRLHVRLGEVKGVLIRNDALEVIREQQAAERAAAVQRVVG